MSLSIREARPGDYEELSRLMVAAYQEFAEPLGGDWEGYREELADIARRAAQGTQLAAETEGRLVGTVTYYGPQADTDGDEWWWWPKDHAYLRALGAHPEHRGQGVGRALTLACIERAKSDGAAGIALNTVSLMQAATALYEALGFRRTGGEVAWGDRQLFSYILEIDANRTTTLVES